MRVLGRRRRQGQAVVEFGIVALLFTLLLFAVIDIGLLLNTWLAVSSGSRDIARSAAVGKRQPALQDAAQKLNLPSVSAVGFASKCCGAGSAVEVQVEYQSCTVTPPVTCTAVPSVSNLYPFPNVDAAGGCSDPVPPALPLCHPFADDFVKVTVIAHGAQVITPLVRPFFGCTNGANPNCNVEVRSSTTLRFEGREF